MRIAELMLKKRDYRLSAESRNALQQIVAAKMSEEVVPSNARMVRNIIEKAMRRQAVRLIRDRSFTRQDLVLIGPEELMEASTDVV